ncbi:MAG: acyl-CoA thioesterase [Dokdonella sp.]|uniref:acyl-CoA thioesterase n=1 Tax=Dokdonella sp. TaxID=2291710 RepID=UPI0025B873BF|nr:acyl-CoA thioesterase [Dokdonella sp.]MBX3701346.1 acyl-CoA thioesterase [Dokdonella sp.]
MRSDDIGASRTRQTRCVEIVFPDHCNHLGSLFGGQALAWMDKAAFLAASRFSGCTVVTARSDRIDFREPVKLGEIVELVATVTSVGRSSMTVRVSLLHEAEPGGTARPATTGEFVMVAVDDSGRAVAVRRGASDA